MDLSNLKPAKGSVKKEKRIGRGQGSGRGGTSTKGIKAVSQDPAIPGKSASKAVKCLCNAGFQNSDSTISAVRNTRPLTFPPCKPWPIARKLTTIDVQTLADAGLISKNDLVKDPG